MFSEAEEREQRKQRRKKREKRREKLKLAWTDEHPKLPLERMGNVRPVEWGSDEVKRREDDPNDRGRRRARVAPLPPPMSSMRPEQRLRIQRERREREILKREREENFLKQCTDSSFSTGAKFPNLDVVAFEIQGDRPEQEDTFMASATKLRTEEEAKAFLIETCRQIDKASRLGQYVDSETGMSCRGVPDGSTANIVYITQKNEVIVANVGDSRTCMVKINNRTGEVTVVPLTKDHKPGDEDERRRIEALGGEVRTFNPYDKRDTELRVNGRLAMSRAFGDFELKGYDDQELVSKEPSITHKDFSAEADDPNFEVFILTACDGMFEHLSRLPTDKQYEALAGAIKTHFVEGGGADTLVQKLVEWAYMGGSRDNITGMLKRLKPFGRKMPFDELMGLGDGHGGSVMSELLVSGLKARALEGLEAEYRAYQQPVFMDKEEREATLRDMTHERFAGYLDSQQPVFRATQEAEPCCAVL